MAEESLGLIDFLRRQLGVEDAILSKIKEEKVKIKDLVFIHKFYSSCSSIYYLFVVCGQPISDSQRIFEQTIIRRLGTML